MRNENLNHRAAQLVEHILADAGSLRIHGRTDPSGATVFDFGIDTDGGLEAGRRLAAVTMAGLGDIQFVPGRADLWPGPAVQVVTDQPLLACMASQYAGWRITGKDFFAMGSGPMRAAACVEELFDSLGYRESSEVAVGVLEAAALPPSEVIRDVAKRCGVAPERLKLLVAPTSSQAGTVQIVARSVETAMHKLMELGFDLKRVVSGYGVAPLPPLAADDLAAIGRTNDAILYGGEVTLWLRGGDGELPAIGPRIPSSASHDHGRPFAEIFARYDHDFYKIDPALFSPAVVTLTSVETGRSFRFGQLLPDVLRASFST